MAVAHDASTESATFTTTSPHTFNHTPTGTPAGIILCIVHGTVSTDLINGAVTYGGVAMERIATCADTAGEPGRVYLYFLGGGIPDGTQTVSIAHTGSSDVKWASVASVTAAAGTETEASGGMWFAGDPSANISEFIFKARSGLVYSGLYSGLAAPSDVTLGAGLSAIQDHDFGNFIARFDRETNPSSGLFNLTMTHATDDAAIVTVNISEKPTVGAHVIGGGVPFSTTATTTNTIAYCGEMIDRDLYMFAVSRDSTSGSANVTCTDNSGSGTWARVNGDTAKKAWVWWKRGAAADVGATITVAAAVGSMTCGIAVCAATNGGAGDPTTNLTDESNNTGDETHATMDPTNNNSAVLFGIFDVINDTNSVTNMSGATSGAMTMVLERLSSGGSDCRLTIGCDEIITGATGSVTWSQTNSTTKTVLFAVAPAAVSNTVTPGVVARSFTVDASAAKGAAQTAPAATARSFTVDAVTIHGAAVAPVATTARVFALDAVTIDDGAGEALVTPDPIATAVAMAATVQVGGAVVLMGATAYVVVMPQSTPRAPVTVAPDVTARSVVLPAVTVKGGSVVQTGFNVTVVLPANTITAPLVIELDEIPMTVVASQPTIVIGEVDDSDKFISRVWMGT